MVWSLFLIVTMPFNYAVQHISDYETMEECFKVREEIVTEAGNTVEKGYQAVCVTRYLGTGV